LLKIKENFDKYCLCVIVVFTLFASVGIMSQMAFAMGQAPSTCFNRYDGSITSAKIIAGGLVYDPIANSDVTFDLPNDMPYTVTFTIHTLNESSQNNTDIGTTWFSSDSVGYGNGYCSNNNDIVAGNLNIDQTENVGSNQNVTITFIATDPHPNSVTYNQTVDFSTLLSSFTYHVNWINPKNLVSP
jgi:hypothetical protein